MLASRRRGSGLLWLVAGLAFSSAVALFLQSNFPTAFSRGEWLTFALCGSVAVACFALEAMRDGFIAFRTGLLFLAALLMAVVGVGIVRGQFTTPQVLITCVSTVLLAVGVAVWAKLQFAPSAWPNLLAQRYPEVPHYELNGVQFAFVPGTLRAKAGETFEFKVVAQNAVDSPRSLGLELGFSTSFSAGREPVVLPVDPELELKAGEVASMTIRALARHTAVGTHALRFEVTVAGRGGRRGRHFRLPRYSPDAPLLLEALVVFAGLTVGLKERGITVEILPSELTSSAAMPKVQRDSLWRIANRLG